jgi:hypothetical protein
MTQAPRKFLYISIALGIAVMGFVRGTRDRADEAGYSTPTARTSDPALQALSASITCGSCAGWRRAP